MSVSIVIDITQNSQNISNNTSNVTVKVNAKWTGGSHNLLEKSGSCTINGTKYTFTSPFNTGKTTSGSSNLFTKTLDIAHNADGTKTLAVSASYTSGTNSGTVAASANKALTTIARKSTLTASNGTLGTAQTLTINRNSSSFTHTITYKCGTASGTIATKTTGASVSWTPPASLASQNTTGKTVSVTFTITTFNGSTGLGSSTKTITCNIPNTDAFRPSATISITDHMGYEEIYGAPIRGLSKYDVVITPILAYGSPIASYSSTFGNTKYTTASFTTGVLPETYGNSVPVNVTLTDKRGYSYSIGKGKTVLEYSPPVISKLTVKRCNQDGTENDKGEFVEAMFSAEVTPLKDKNMAFYALKYKKVTDDESLYVTHPFTELENTYSVTDATYIFSADSSSSYDVALIVYDDFTETSRTTSASTAFTLMHFKADGTGMAVGKIAEESNLFDIGVASRFFGGIKPPVLEPNTDLNDVKTPNTYTGDNISHYNYLNCPVASGTFTLFVESCGEDGQVKQTYVSCSKYKPERFSRFFYQGEWGDWFWASTDEYILYENASGVAGAITLSASVSHYRYIEIYFTDNNGKTGGYTKVYSPNGKNVCLQITEPSSQVYSRQTLYAVSGTTITPDTTNASYFRVNANGTITTSFGTNYIRIVRVIGRA